MRDYDLQNEHNRNHGQNKHTKLYRNAVVLFCVSDSLLVRGYSVICPMNGNVLVILCIDPVEVVK